MTNNNVTKQLHWWMNDHCYNNKKHLWCSCKGKQCWEYSGLTSRFVEAHMKGIMKNIKGVYFIPCLHDATDFFGFRNGIMTDHPEWKERLQEMSIYGRQWQRLIKYYDECDKLAEQGKYKAITDIIKCFDITNSKLYYYNLKQSNNVHLKEYVIMGSIVPHGACDEFDICHSCIIKKIPNCYFSLKCEIYNKKSQCVGWNACNLYHPNVLTEEEDTTRISTIQKLETKICDNFNNYKMEYNNKMRELCDRYTNGEIIYENELPVIEDKKEKTIDMESFEELKKSIVLLKMKRPEFIDYILNNDICDDTHSDINTFVEGEYMHIKYETLYKYVTQLLGKIQHYNYLCNEHNINTENDNLLIINKLESYKEYIGNKYENAFCEEYKLHNEMQQYVKCNNSFRNVTYHYCPHYILYDEKDDRLNTDDFEIYSVEIDDPELRENNFGVFTCVVSFSKNHALHKNNRNDEFEVEYNDAIWSISEPIQFNTFYEEGLMNSQ